MEKLYPIKYLSLIALLLCSVFIGSAQSNLMVFKVNGSPILKVKDSLRSLSKGSEISSNAIVSLRANDDLLLINEKGNCYKIDEPREYEFSEILKHPFAEDNSSFTKKYFTYVWNQFVKNTKRKSKSGVVFRGDKINLLQPRDSIRFNTPEVKFVWSSDSEESIFHLKNMETGHISKIGVTGNSLTLFIDNEILEKGKSYKWAISDDKFPNYEQVEFYSFTILTRDEFRLLKPDIDMFKKELSALGFTSNEIKSMLCIDYKICY